MRMNAEDEVGRGQEQDEPLLGTMGYYWCDFHVDGVMEWAGM